MRIGLERAGLVDVALGVQGDTNIPFEAEAGACYVAAAVRLRGDSVGLSLAPLGAGSRRTEPRRA